METIEITQRRAKNDGISSAYEEETTKEEIEEESEATKVMKMLEKASSRPKVEVPLYDGNISVEVLMDWISSLDKYFDYEEVDDKKKVKFAATRLKVMQPYGGINFSCLENEKGNPKLRSGIIW